MQSSSLKGHFVDEHDYCMGPRYRNPVYGIYLILNGFTKKDEVISSDWKLMNQIVMKGEKTTVGLTKHYYDKIATKSFILRKQNNMYIEP